MRRNLLKFYSSVLYIYGIDRYLTLILVVIVEGGLVCFLCGCSHSVLVICLSLLKINKSCRLRNNLNVNWLICQFFGEKKIISLKPEPF